MLVHVTGIAYRVTYMVGRTKLKQNVLAVLKHVFLILQ